MKLRHALIFCLLLASCGLFKKTVKDKELIATEHREQSNTDSIGLITDKSFIIEHSEIDTTVTTPEKTVKQVKEGISLDSLINGITAISDGLVDVKLILNPVTNTLQTIAVLHPQIIPVKLSKTVTTHKDVVQQTEKKVAIISEDKSNSTKIHKEKEPVKIGVLIAYFVCIFCGLYLGFLVYRKFIKPLF